MPEFKVYYEGCQMLEFKVYYENAKCQNLKSIMKVAKWNNVEPLTREEFKNYEKLVRYSFTVLN